ncbi:unnamed protein product [Lampetra fluviatilis]
MERRPIASRHHELLNGRQLSWWAYGPLHLRHYIFPRPAPICACQPRHAFRRQNGSRHLVVSTPGIAAATGSSDASRGPLSAVPADNTVLFMGERAVGNCVVSAPGTAAASGSSSEPRAHAKRYLPASPFPLWAKWRPATAWFPPRES